MQEYRAENSEFVLRGINESDFDFLYKIATTPDVVYQSFPDLAVLTLPSCFDFEFVYSRKDVKTLVQDVWAQDLTCKRFVLVSKADARVVALCAILRSADNRTDKLEIASLDRAHTAESCHGLQGLVTSLEKR